MEARIDPRGSLSSIFQPAPQLPRPLSNFMIQQGRRSSINTLQKPKRDQCFDWIFSSSSNAHIAIDRAAFATYHHFESYALTLSDQSRIPVRGIGTVELRIRCKPGSRGHRILILENVLHVPDWLCNIFSDVYFHSAPGFDFAWNEFGVCFVVREGGKPKPYGYTENFRGLDRLVLARKQEGRSPMLEDKEREVFSINLTWPQSQINKWERWMLMQEERSHMGSSTQDATESKMKQMSCSPRSISSLGTVAKSRGPGINNLRASLSMMSLSSLAKRIV